MRSPHRPESVVFSSGPASGRADGSALGTFGLAERRALLEELGVIAGGVDNDTPSETLEVFFVDPSPKTEQYGGADGWARCVKGYLNARGYSASIGVAASREAALAAARSRWGIVVIHEGQGQAASQSQSQTRVERIADRDPRVQTGVGLKAPTIQAAPRPGQLGLPGVVLGRAKRTRVRSQTPTRVAS